MPEVPLFLVRHSVRHDECPRDTPAIPYEAIPCPRYDVPITSRAIPLAQKAAKEHIINLHQTHAFRVIYSSPFIRCVHTAVEIAVCLSIPEVCIIPSLGHCAAAAQEGLMVYPENFLPLDALQRLLVREREVTLTLSPMYPPSASYEQAVRGLVRDHAGKVTGVLAVSHREGFMNMLGRRFLVPYCAVVRWDVCPTSNAWKMGEMLH